MNGWFMLAVIIVSAFCGAVIEHVRTSDRYEFRINHLHTCYMDEIKRNAKLEAEHAEPIDVILDRLLDECPDESEVKTFAAGQDPRD